MSIFKRIDRQILEASESLNATLEKDRSGYPKVLRTFEERRIDWTENGIRKAIIIQPTFEITGVDSSRWNFNLVAWKGIGAKRLALHESLAYQVKFSVINDNIDLYLEKGVEFLKRVTIEDLIS